MYNKHTFSIERRQHMFKRTMLKKVLAIFIILTFILSMIPSLYLAFN